LSPLHSGGITSPAVAAQVNIEASDRPTSNSMAAGVEETVRRCLRRDQQFAARQGLSRRDVGAGVLDPPKWFPAIPPSNVIPSQIQRRTSV
jgi:hypothetical protein